MFKLKNHKLFYIVVITTILTLIGATVVLADVVTSDVDFINVGNQALINLGNVAPSDVINTSTSFQLVCNGKSHADYNDLVTVYKNSATIPSDGALTAGDATFNPIPASWPDDTSGGGSTNCPDPAPVLNDNGNSTVTITAPTTAGTYDFVIQYKVCQDNDPLMCGGIAPDDITGNVPAVTFRLTVVSDSTPPTAAPTQSPDANLAGWNNSNVTVTWNWTDNVGGSGIDPANCTTSSVSSGEGTITLTANCKDLAGNTGSASYTVKVDKTAPQLSGCDVPDVLWHATDVTLYCHYTDNGSGPATQDVSLTTNVAAGNETNNATASAGGAQACDTVGNCADSPADITGNMIDKKVPQLTGCDAPDGLWHAGDVTLKCTYTDGGSGPATQYVSLNTVVAAGTETNNATASAGGAQACDAVGNCADSPADIDGNKVDKKAPQFVSCESPDGSWHADDVTLKCTYSDGGSGPATQNVSLTTNVAAGSETDGAVASAGGAKACDAVGNCAASPEDISGNKVDKKAPVSIGCDTPDGLWHAGDVTLKCYYTDDGSGPATQDVSLTTNVAAGTETNNATASAGGAQACDGVGNCAASPANISGNKVDKKAPTITITAPSATSYLLNQAVAANYSCSDGGSGVASCAGPVANGSNINTATVGSKTFTVTAIDNVGNTASSSVIYSVQYNFSGFFAPVDNNLLNLAKAGQAIPIKWRLTDANGYAVSDPGNFASITSINTGTCTAVTDEIETYAGSSGLQYLGDGYWQWNWKTPKTYAGGCRTMTLTLSDGTTHEANFKFK